MQCPAPFPNPQSICYFNAVLQCLLRSVDKQTFLKIRPNDNRPVNIITYIDILTRLNKKNIKYMDTVGYQCAGEMYTAIMNAYEDFPRFTNKFLIAFNVSITCLACGKTEALTEHTNIGILPNQPNATLQFDSIEEVSLQCSCGGLAALKRTVVDQYPEIIVYQVKREQDPNLINFPDVLSLCLKTYRMIASVHHMGSHYASSVLFDDWWIADDDRISRGRLDASSIYMVFYRRFIA
jgi:ubiquitin C-terminal hydrolase